MKYGLLSFLFLLLACVTPGDAHLEEQNYSLGDIKQVILSVIGDQRALSQNQRTYLSQYFGLKAEKKFDPQKSKRRLYARITILGDRRPYDISIDVVVEQKKGFGYEEIGNDLGKAHEIAKEIDERLHKGIENRNVIDDFRAF